MTLPLYRCRIDGRQVDSDEIATIKSPYDGHPVGRVAVGTAAHMESAIDSASRAFETLRGTAAHERAGWLGRIAEGIAAKAEDLARLMTAESGKPLRYARAEVSRAVTTFSVAAAEARGFAGSTLPLDQAPGLEGHLGIVTRVPRGPVGAISPFNFPLNLVAHKLAPALAVGAPVVLKPPAQSPLTAHELSVVVDESGVPGGAFNVVHCPPSVGQRLAEDERLRVLSFTGSEELGWRLKELAPKKQVILELGGTAPCIIDEGVSLDAVLPRIVESAWANGGQICIKTQRIFVLEAAYEDFLQRFIAATEQVVVGDPSDERTVVGPLIEPRHVTRVLDWIEEARGAGARVWCGAKCRGPLLWPTVLSGTREDQRVRALEVFGPVTVVEPAATFEAALDLANAGRFGLQASVFTPNLAHALLAYERLQFGAVIVNEPPTFRVDNYPYGGTKDSGFGREGVRAAMEELTEPKVLVLRGRA